jgi:hypothetical protein
MSVEITMKYGVCSTMYVSIRSQIYVENKTWKLTYLYENEVNNR